MIYLIYIYIYIYIYIIGLGLGLIHIYYIYTHTRYTFLATCRDLQYAVLLKRTGTTNYCFLMHVVYAKYKIASYSEAGWLNKSPTGSYIVEIPIIVVYTWYILLTCCLAGV